MNWFSGIFMLALVVSLLTGKAYFRGVYARAENPRMYWMTVLSYALLAVLIPILEIFKV
jgi:hypothetical protein